MDLPSILGACFGVFLFFYLKLFVIERFFFGIRETFALDKVVLYSSKREPIENRVNARKVSIFIFLFYTQRVNHTLKTNDKCRFATNYASAG